jgi:hypothetical protein
LPLRDGTIIEPTTTALRVDVAPGVGNARLNPRDLVVESASKVVVWLGSGDYPCLPIPEGWTLTRDEAVWDRAVVAWRIRHQLEDTPQGGSVK